MKRIFALAVALLIFAAAHVVAAPISGKVLFQGNRAPVPHALIDFSSGSSKQRAVTADDGSYYLQDLPAGSYNVTITYREYSANSIARSRRGVRASTSLPERDLPQPEKKSPAAWPGSSIFRSPPPGLPVALEDEGGPEVGIAPLPLLG